MLVRVGLTAVAATAVLASGCSSGKPAAPRPPRVTKAPTTQPSTTTSASPQESTTSEPAPPAGPTLAASACVEIVGANLDLATASGKDDARKAADTLEKYDPPADVKAAIERLADTGGTAYNEPDYDDNTKLIDGWVKRTCPM